MDDRMIMFTRDGLTFMYRVRGQLSNPELIA